MTDQRRLAAVLFDMDGTLVDSEKIWQEALEELADRLGGDLAPAVRASMVGTTTPEAIAMLFTAIGPEVIAASGFGPEAAATWLEDRVGVLFAGGLTWRPGARELLDAVRAAGLPTALVTATAKDLVDIMLGTIGRDNFDAIVTDDDVVDGKPHAEPYASAATALGVPAGNCVAIEDSPIGIASALAAGCVVVAVPAEVDLSHIDGVTHVRSLADVDVAFLAAAVAAQPV
ncbi:MAG TPA: HAD family phosphatase [Micromonosporaceae bacterium]